MNKQDELVIFRWATCDGGYTMHSDYQGVRVMDPTSDEWSYYDPGFEVPDIHRKLAETAPTDDGFFSFVEQYGTLTLLNDYTSSCSLSNVSTLHSKVTAVLKLWEEGEKQLALKFLSRSYPASTFEVGVNLSPDGHLDYKFVPNNLYSFIEFQLIKELANGLEYKACEAPACNRRFAISTGSGAITKRQTKTKRAKFCSDACRQATHREKRKNT